jgi:hypothetical protein
VAQTRVGFRRRRDCLETLTSNNRCQCQLRSAHGPEPTLRDVRYLVAIEGKADIWRTLRKDAFDPFETLVGSLSRRDLSMTTSRFVGDQLAEDADKAATRPFSLAYATLREH